MAISTSDNTRIRVAELDTAVLRQELEAAAQVQRSLLPQKHCCFAGWQVGYGYEPAGYVSGDYVDLIPSADGGVHFVLGDVSGKGVGASMLMSYLHATFRALLSERASLEDVLTKTSKMFCEISLPSQFATLILGTARPNGSVQICNAGHMPVLVVGRNGVTSINSTGLFAGIFCNQSFTSERLKLQSRDTLFLYSDGLSETENAEGEEYGEARLTELLYSLRAEEIPTLLSKISQDVNVFGGKKPIDDRSFLALRRL